MIDSDNLHEIESTTPIGHQKLGTPGKIFFAFVGTLFIGGLLLIASCQPAHALPGPGPGPSPDLRPTPGVHYDQCDSTIPVTVTVFRDRPTDLAIRELRADGTVSDPISTAHTDGGDIVTLNAGTQSAGITRTILSTVEIDGHFHQELGIYSVTSLSPAQCAVLAQMHGQG